MYKYSKVLIIRFWFDGKVGWCQERSLSRTQLMKALAAIILYYAAPTNDISHKTA